MAKVTLPIMGGEADDLGELDESFGELTVEDSDEVGHALNVSVKTKAGEVAFVISSSELARIASFFE